VQKNTFAKHKIDSIDAILEIAYAFQNSRVLLTACEFEIFSAIDDEGLSAEEISKKIDTDTKATERLLNALCGLKLLYKKEGLYYNTELSLKHLVHGSEEFMGNLEYIASTWDMWSNLSQTIKTGMSTDAGLYLKNSEKIIDSFASAAFWRASIEAPEIIKLINLKNVNKILDLGGGKGAYAREFVKQKPGINVTIYEISQVAKYARQYIAEWGLQQQISVIEGDFTSQDIGKGYDLIFLSRIIELYSIWDNVKLLRKCFDALKNDGMIVIHEMVINDYRTSPLQHTMLSLNLLLNTKSGDVYTETDIWVLLKEAWFRNIRRIDTPFDTTLMIGIK